MSNSVVERPAVTDVLGEAEAGVFSPAELAEFLRDPIAYGQFDWSDPITLTEFQTSRRFHGVYAAPLVC